MANDDVVISVGMDTSNYDRGTKKIELTAIQAAKASASLNRQIRNLKKETREGNLTARQYGAAVLELKNNFKLLQSGVQGSLAVMNQFGVQATRAQSKMKRFGAVGAQQVGYQLQDFAVQVQGGTNALVALGQQGSQLLGIFGPAGAIAGAALAIGTAILRPLLDAEAAAEQFAKNMKKTTEAADEATSSFEDLGSAVGNFVNDLDMIDTAQFKASMKDLGESAGKSFAPSFLDVMGGFLIANLWTGFETWAEVRGRLAGQNFAEAFGSTVTEMGTGVAEQFGEAIAAMDVQAIDDLLISLSANLPNATASGMMFFEQMVKTKGEIEDMNWAVDAVKSGLFDTTKQAIELKDEYGAAVAESLTLSGMDIKSGISDAADEAARLAQNLGISISAAAGIKLDEFRKGVAASPFGFTPSRGQTSSEGIQVTGEDGKMMSLSEWRKANEPDKKGGSKGGRSSLSEDERAIKKIFDSTRTDAELLASGVQELDKYLQQGGISTDTYNRALKDLNERYDETTRYAMELSREFQDNLSSAFFSVVDGSKSAGDALMGFVNNVLRNIAEQQFNDRIGKPLGDALGSIISGITLNANGNVFDQSGVHAFAKGGIVNSPTLFPFAKGTGLMGEAGPEAIMPLSRGKDGKLGVSGGGTKVIINNYSNESAESQQNSNGDLVVTIGRAVAADITGGGPSYRAIKNTFGLNQPMQRRG